MLRYLTALVGLALAVGSVQAQEYVDLEAERRNQGQNAAAAPAGGQNVGELYYQLQLLQQEVMTLRGQVEQQTYQLRQLKQQNLERYMDLDRRLNAGVVSTGSGGQSTAATNSSAPARSSSKPAREIPGEADAYRSAYNLVRSQQFDEAVASFKRFLRDYPDGKYASNAHYWLGELYLVIVPQDLESSRQSFTLLLEQYPENSKIPDAMYKLGKVYFQKGNREKAQQYLERVVREYGNSSSSAVNLARDFLAQNY